MTWDAYGQDGWSSSPKRSVGTGETDMIHPLNVDDELRDSVVRLELNYLAWYS